MEKCSKGKTAGRKLVMEKCKYEEQTALHCASRGNKPSTIDVISKLIDIEGRELVMDRTSNGWTALNDVCRISSSYDDSSAEIALKLIEVGGRDLVIDSCQNILIGMRSIEPFLTILKVGGKELACNEKILG